MRLEAEEMNKPCATVTIFKLQSEKVKEKGFDEKHLSMAMKLHFQ